MCVLASSNDLAGAIAGLIILLGFIIGIIVAATKGDDGSF